jgi:hypothetical protein
LTVPENTWLQLMLIVPPLELPLRGHVTWSDPAHQAIGVSFSADSPQHMHDLSRAILGLAFEHESARPAAALFVDDAATTALLCEPLRRHGYVPRVVRTPLEAAECLGRPRPPVHLAIVSHRALGMPGADVLAYLAAEHPNVARIAIDEPAAVAHASVDEILPPAYPERELEALLASLDH